MTQPTGVLAPLLKALIANPDLALFFVLLGIFLLYIEFNRPGKVVFGALGIFAGTLGVYAVFQHPISPAAAAVLPLGLLLGVIGIRFPAVGALGIVTLTWALNHLLLSSRIDIPSAFLISMPFVLVTNWLGAFALQARRNKRLPRRTVQDSVPSPIRAHTPPRPRTG